MSDHQCYGQPCDREVEYSVEFEEPWGNGPYWACPVHVLVIMNTVAPGVSIGVRHDRTASKWRGWM